MKFLVVLGFILTKQVTQLNATWVKLHNNFFSTRFNFNLSLKAVGCCVISIHFFRPKPLKLRDVKPIQTNATKRQRNPFNCNAKAYTQFLFIGFLLKLFTRQLVSALEFINFIPATLISQINFSTKLFLFVFFLVLTPVSCCVVTIHFYRPRPLKLSDIKC